MSKYPWMPFYPADYLLDTALLSLATRGAWMDILCHLWRAVPRGTLTHSPDAWTVLLRCSAIEFSVIVAELSKYRVCDVVTNCNSDVTPDCNYLVTLTSRRMIRDEKTRESTRLRVAKHRVTHHSNDDVTSSSNAPCNADVHEHIIVRSHNQSHKSESKKEKKGIVKGNTLPDADWLATLKANPAYAGLDVDRELGKCQAWLQAKHPRKVLSRSRFVNWLNNAERPLTLQPAPPSRTSRNLAALPEHNEAP